MRLEKVAAAFSYFDISFSLTAEAFLIKPINFFGLPRFEYVNPVAGLVIYIAGMVLLTLGYDLLAVPPIVVGLLLVSYYRKNLMELIVGA